MTTVNREVLANFWSVEKGVESVLDNSTAEYQYVEIKENSPAIANETKLSIKLNDRDNWYLPSQAYLAVAIKCARTGGDLTYARNMTLCGDGMTIFDDATLRFDSVKISQVDKVGSTHFVKSMLEYSPTYAESIADKQFFYPDQVSDDHTVANVREVTQTYGGAGAGGYMPSGPRFEVQANLSAAGGVWESAGGGLPIVKKNPRYNEQYVKRCNRLSGTGQISFFVPLSEIFSCVQHMDKAIRGTTMEIELNKCKTYQECFYGQNVDIVNDPTFTFERVSLFIPRLLPSLSARAHIEGVLNSNASRRYKYEDVNHFVNPSIPLASRSVNWRVASDFSRINKVVVYMQLHDRLTNYELNPLQFDLLSLSDIQCRINGQQYPMELYQLDALGVGKNRIIAELQNCTKKSFRYEDGSMIGFKNWETMYPVVVFDLSNQPSSAFENSRVQDLEIRLNRSADAAAVWDLHALVYCEKELEISLASGKTIFTKT